MQVDGAEKAEEVMRAAGLVPLELYRGPSHRGRVRCAVCGVVKRPTLREVVRGWRCQHRIGEYRPGRVTVRTAVREMAAAGYETLEPYPGVTTEGWRVRCAVCGVREGGAGGLEPGPYGDAVPARREARVRSGRASSPGCHGGAGGGGVPGGGVRAVGAVSGEGPCRVVGAVCGVRE